MAKVSQPCRERLQILGLLPTSFLRSALPRGKQVVGGKDRHPRRPDTNLYIWLSSASL